MRNLTRDVGSTELDPFIAAGVVSRAGRIRAAVSVSFLARSSWSPSGENSRMKVQNVLADSIA